MSGAAPAVGGLPLPVELLTALEKGLWRPPADGSILTDVFDDVPELPEFYDYPAIERQNRSWQAMPVASVFGHPVEGRSLGIDPHQSIVIADLGPDMPIVLDYRISRESPRVLYLGFSEIPVWIEVASSFSELLHRLNISDG